MRIHGTAHVQKQQHFHGIVTFGNHLYIQPACVTRCRTDSIVEVQFISGTGTREFAQASHGNFYVARTELNIVVKVF